MRPTILYFTLSIIIKYPATRASIISVMSILNYQISEANIPLDIKTFTFIIFS